MSSRLTELFDLLASPKPSLSKCRALLKKDGALANAREGGLEDGRNALEVACMANNEDAVKCLVKYKADVSRWRPVGSRLSLASCPLSSFFSLASFGVSSVFVRF